MLHGAGAQRIQAGVDGIVHPRQAHIMADHFRLAETGKTDRTLAALAAETCVRYTHIGQVDAGGAMTQFKDQRFFMIQAAITRDGRDTRRKGFATAGGATLIVHAHHKTSCNALASAAKSSSVLVSVAARISRFSTLLFRGSRREAGTPAITPLAASASTTGAAGLASLMVNSLKNACVTTSTPGSAANRSARAPALA